MSSKVPTTREINWLAMVFHLLLFFAFSYIFSMFFPDADIFVSVFVFSIISLLLKILVPKLHRKGMSLVKDEKFKEAIPFFEESYIFFTKYNWVDKYRIISLLSVSNMCYKEMALANIAFCYSQIGNGKKAKEYYERTLLDFPENSLAKVGLRMLNSIQNIEE